MIKKEFELSKDDILLKSHSLKYIIAVIFLMPYYKFQNLLMLMTTLYTVYTDNTVVVP